MLEFCQALFTLMFVSTVVGAAVVRDRRRKIRERLEYLVEKATPEELESGEWVPYDRYN